MWRNSLCSFPLKALLCWVGFDPFFFRTKSALISGPTPPFFCCLSYFLSYSDVQIIITCGLSDSQHRLRTWILRYSVLPITIRNDGPSLRARREWTDLGRTGFILGVASLSFLPLLLLLLLVVVVVVVQFLVFMQFICENQPFDYR
jgi:hypothetical protein